MNLTIETQQDGVTALVRCAGRLVRGADARRFRRGVGAALSRHRHLVLDLGGVTAVDAHGMGVMAVLIRRAAERGRALRVSRADDRTTRLLQLMHLEAPVVGALTAMPSGGTVDEAGGEKRRR